MLIVCGLIGASIWLIILALPWSPWSTKESLDSKSEDQDQSLEDVTILIPARNEAQEIGATLNSVKAQDTSKVQVIMVDDQSTDATVEIARQTYGSALKVISGKPIQSGWAGKLWALEQGRKEVKTKYTLLLDADIELGAGILKSLVKKAELGSLGYVSLMAQLRMKAFWEKLLMPAYIYFFKLLYPFKLSNSKSKNFASAAGGCFLIQTRILEEIGGFSSLKEAFIDDCTLASLVKSHGHRGWTGLTRSVTSHRDYSSLSEIWNLVARFGFTYLRYSKVALIFCSILLFCCFIALPVSVFLPSQDFTIRAVLVAGLLAMFLAYLPTVVYYRLSPLWVLLKPLAGTLYMCMTWTSAVRYWRGKRTIWKGRVYDHDLSQTKDAA